VALLDKPAAAPTVQGGHDSKHASPVQEKQGRRRMLAVCAAVENRSRRNVLIGLLRRFAAVFDHRFSSFGEEIQRI